LKDLNRAVAKQSRRRRISVSTVTNSDGPTLSGILSDTHQLASHQKKRLAGATLHDLNAADSPTAQAAAHEAGLHVQPPDQITSDRALLIIIGAFAVVLIGSVAALIVALFVPTAGAATTQTIITVFTSTVAFLGGLFAQSPMQAAGKSTSAGGRDRRR
jgi:hypothetical protein